MNIFQELTDAFEGTNEIDEMSKKYLNTYLLLRTAGERDIVVCYLGFEGDYHIFSDENGVKIKLSHATKQRIFCKFPERILFNHNKQALEFVRLPNRQYRRGICKDNAIIQDPVRILWGLATSSNLNHKILQSALKAQYPENCESAINTLLKPEAVSIALNSKFAISLSFTKDPDIYFLFYSNKCIGYWTQKDKKFVIKNKEFRQEVLDNLALFNPYQVEIC